MAYTFSSVLGSRKKEWSGMRKTPKISARKHACTHARITQIRAHAPVGLDECPWTCNHTRECANAARVGLVIPGAWHLDFDGDGVTRVGANLMGTLRARRHRLPHILFDD